MAEPIRHEPGPGQESCWDYPRPPALQPDSRRVQVWSGATLIADSDQAFRVLETYHPPTWYIRPEDVFTRALTPSSKQSFCEWKGVATYYSVETDVANEPGTAWTYFDPASPFEPIAAYIAFYPRDFLCRVDGDEVTPQPGGFYGGWVTNDVVGPFKGSMGMNGW